MPDAYLVVGHLSRTSMDIIAASAGSLVFFNSGQASHAWGTCSLLETLFMYIVRSALL